eukprot:SAG22_NODE_15404_length_349_cov_1.036000_1_plen_48_part_10
MIDHYDDLGLVTRVNTKDDVGTVYGRVCKAVDPIVRQEVLAANQALLA